MQKAEVRVLKADDEPEALQQRAKVSELKNLEHGCGNVNSGCALTLKIADAEASCWHMVLAEGRRKLTVQVAVVMASTAFTRNRASLVSVGLQ